MVWLPLVNTQMSPAILRTLDDALGVEFGVLQQGDGGGLGKVAAAADGDEIVLRLHHVTVAGDDEGFVLVGDGQQGLEAAQGAIGAPVLPAPRRRAPG